MSYKRFLTILLWLIRITVVGLSISIFGWFFYNYFSPWSKLEIVYDFSSDSKYISHLSPWQRLMPPMEENGDWFQSIKDDLVYFDVKCPKWFKKMTVKITFQNTGQPIFELGANVNNQEGYYNAPLQNMLIDGLNWDKITEGGVSLHQKTKKYETIPDFLNNPPSEEKIGEYFYSLPDSENIVNINNNTDVAGLDYVISGYAAPIMQNNWLYQTNAFDVDKLYKNKDGGIRFRLSAPGLKQSAKTIQVSEIKITFEKPVLKASNIFTRIKNYISRRIK